MRKIYLDNVRWMTVVLVVIYHVVFMFNGVSTAGVIGPFRDFQPQDTYQYIVYPWFMLLLFTVSGMAARFELNGKSGKQFIKDRTRKLLVPSTIGLLIWGWILGYYNMSIAGAIDQMTAVPKPILYIIMCTSGIGPLWYIQELWIFSIFLVVIRKLEKDRLYRLGGRTNIVVLCLLAVVIYGAAQILNMPVVICYRFGIYGAGFLIGYFILSHDEVMDRMGKYWILFTVLGVISGVAFVVMYSGQPYPEHSVLDTWMCNLYAWFGTLGVLAFMKKWGNFENSFSKWMSKKSWGLYIFHYMFIAAAAWYLTPLLGDTSPLLVYILVAIAGFGGSYILYELVSRIPVIRWCVLGMRKCRCDAKQ